MKIRNNALLFVFTLSLLPHETPRWEASSFPRVPGPAPALAAQVEVRRTAHGVPHIKADNLEAAAYALAYVQLEDYGARIALGLLRARGEMGRWFGRDSMESDYLAQRAHAIAVQKYPLLDAETR